MHGGFAPREITFACFPFLRKNVALHGCVGGSAWLFYSAIEHTKAFTAWQSRAAGWKLLHWSNTVSHLFEAH
eukprot:2151347-Heterocapsa_arctica.AAC.1